MKDLYIIPECYIDTCLVESLLETEGVNHQKGCNVVTGVMDSKYADKFAVGIIDDDKKKPSYVNEFYNLATTDFLVLLKHLTRPHYLIMVKPAMDGFILGCVGKKGIDLSEYDLPSDLKSFTKETKCVATKNDIRFKKLFYELKDVPEMVLLAKLLNYFKEKGFASKEEEFKMFFL